MYGGVNSIFLRVGTLNLALSKGFNVTSSVSSKLSKRAQAAADKAIAALKHSGSESLVVCGSNETSVQILTNKLNSVLGAYNTTINVNNPINLFKSEDEKMNKFANDVANGNGPDAVILYGVNPAYTLPNGKAFAKGLKKVKTSVSMALYADETATNCKYVASDLHSLESWSDHQPVKNHYGLAQPTIRPLHNTASALESFLVWAGDKRRGGKDSHQCTSHIDLESTSDKSRVAMFVKHNKKIDLKATL